jgi:hypothetical protein
MGFFSSLFGTSGGRASTARKGTTKTPHRAPSPSLPDAEIPAGSYEIPVEGLQWCKIKLSNNGDRVFSLTPKNTYQIDNDWPEGDIVNVCRKGSRRATGKNWVGYIPTHRMPGGLVSTVLSHGTTNVHARVEVKGSKRSVTLLLPRGY